MTCTAFLIAGLGAGFILAKLWHGRSPQAAKLREAIRIIQAGEIGALKTRATEIRTQLGFIMAACDELLSIDAASIPQLETAEDALPIQTP